MKLSQLAHAVRERVGYAVDNLRTEPPAQCVAPQDLFAQASVGRRGETPSSRGPQPIPTRDWTVLVYMEGRDQLAYSTDLALNKLEQVGSTPRAHVVVQATQQRGPGELTVANMRNLPTRRYYIQRDAEAKTVSSPVLQEFPGQLPCNEQSLADFVAWGVQSFPSRHVALIVKKHGAGFASVTRDGHAYVPLSARELDQALFRAEQATGQKLDLLSFDSCSMQQMEVAYQLRDRAAVVTGSEEDVKAAAFPYGNLLYGLHTLPENAGPEEAGQKVVEIYSQRVASGMQSALRTETLGELATAVRALVDAVLDHKVPRDLLYTAMQDTRPMERGETASLAYNFHDLGSFLKTVQQDARFPEAVRQAATNAFECYEGSLVARYASPDRAELKDPTGATAFFPWKAMPTDLKASYEKLDWVKDSGWGQLLDYTLGGPVALPAPAPSAARDLTLGQRFGRWGLSQYKKYISPHLTVTCSYTPTCSQFAREAVEQFGLWEGGKMGALRFFSCTGQLHGADPLPGHEHEHEAQADPTMRGRLGDFLLAPPTVSTDPAVVARHQRWIGMARTAGSLAGGVALALIALPAGAAVGAFVGWKAGSGQLESHCQEMASRYGAPVVQGFRNVAEPVAAHVGGERLRSAVGATAAGVLSGVAGAALGALGGAFQSWKWGQLFGGLWAENRVKESCGEFPQHPETAAILAKDYAGAL